MFEIEYAESVERDLLRLRAYHRKAILDAVDEQLAREPLTETRRRKPLPGLTPPGSMYHPFGDYASESIVSSMTWMRIEGS